MRRPVGTSVISVARPASTTTSVSVSSVLIGQIRAEKTPWQAFRRPAGWLPVSRVGRSDDVGGVPGGAARLPVHACLAIAAGYVESL